MVRDQAGLTYTLLDSKNHVCMKEIRQFCITPHIMIRPLGWDNKTEEHLLIVCLVVVATQTSTIRYTHMTSRDPCDVRRILRLQQRRFAATCEIKTSSVPIESLPACAFENLHEWHKDLSSDPGADLRLTKLSTNT
jgi:hypothetical protein